MSKDGRDENLTGDRFKSIAYGSMTQQSASQATVHQDVPRKEETAMISFASDPDQVLIFRS